MSPVASAIRLASVHCHIIGLPNMHWELPERPEQRQKVFIVWLQALSGTYTCSYIVQVVVNAPFTLMTTTKTSNNQATPHHKVQCTLLAVLSEVSCAAACRVHAA